MFSPKISACHSDLAAKMREPCAPGVVCIRPQVCCLSVGLPGQLGIGSRLKRQLIWSREGL